MINSERQKDTDKRISLTGDSYCVFCCFVFFLLFSFVSRPFFLQPSLPHVCWKEELSQKHLLYQSIERPKKEREEKTYTLLHHCIMYLCCTGVFEKSGWLVCEFGLDFFFFFDELNNWAAVTTDRISLRKGAKERSKNSSISGQKAKNYRKTCATFDDEV